MSTDADQVTDTYSERECLALGAWEVTTKTHVPSERIYTNGGPLDENAWCIHAADAILAGEPLPDVAKGLPAPDGMAESIRTQARFWEGATRR